MRQRVSHRTMALTEGSLHSSLQCRLFFAVATALFGFPLRYTGRMASISIESHLLSYTHATYHCIKVRLPINMQLAGIDHQKLFLLPGSLLLLLPVLTGAQHPCQISQPLTYGIVHVQAISIRTNILSNTTFFPIPEVAVTIHDVPTSLDGVTIFRWTETRTYFDTVDPSPTISGPQTTSTARDSYFVMRVMGSKQHSKRQSGTYWINTNGTMTNDCTSSPMYAITNGVLTSTLNGVHYTYSTSAGMAYAPFVPSTIPGPITTTFSLGSNQVLTWQNSEFYNGQASFCALSNGTVYAVFQENSQPDGCLYIQLSLFSVSSCQGISLATIMDPPGPSGYVMQSINLSGGTERLRNTS